MLCEPHLRRGLSIQADVTVSGEAMCKSCFAGRPVSRKELAGDSAPAADREADRNYYYRNRVKILVKHRKWREANRGKSVPCVAS